MRAIVCRTLGPPDTLVLEDVPSPAMKPGHVRIAVAAAGVNFADTLKIAGKYQDKSAPPFIPGFEAAGVVREVARDVTGVRVGDRVIAQVPDGAFAEELVCAAQDVYTLPPQIDLVEAAGFPIAYGTAEVALHHRGQLKAGETLLVLGAAGGVGLCAVELGKLMGARVIAAARGSDKLAIAKAHGADALIDYASEDLRERVKALTDNKGANVVFDPVGGDAFDAALRATAWEGRVLVVGFAAGRVPQPPANLLLIKNISAVGVYWGAYRKHDPAVLQESMRRLIQWWGEGKLKPHVSHRLPLADATKALNLLVERKSTGKVVLTMGGR